jgi:hypothetical protein
MPTARERKQMKAQEKFQEQIKTQINGDKNHGWGADDSVAVILAVVAEETGTDVSDLSGIIPLIKAVVNPSQFRQSLESKSILNKAASGVRASAIKSLLDGIA